MNTHAAPRIWAHWLLIGGGLAYSAVAAASLFLIQWDDISRSLNLSLGIVIVLIVVAWSASVGIFGALPIAAGFELRNGARVARTMCVVVVVAAVAVAPPLRWYGLVVLAIYGAALLLVSSPGVRNSLEGSRGPRWERPIKRASIAYVLLVSGGMFGLHHFYLRRTWQGVLWVALLLLGASSWPYILYFLLLPGLLALNIRDAILMSDRIKDIKSEMRFVHTMLNEHPDLSVRKPGSSGQSERFGKRIMRGPSAESVRRVALACALTCLGCLVGGGIAVVVGANEEVLGWAALLMVLSALAMGASAAGFGLSIRRESRLGYTSLEGRMRHLPQVDPRTAVVIRRAGAPFVTVRRTP